MRQAERACTPREHPSVAVALGLALGLALAPTRVLADEPAAGAPEPDVARPDVSPEAQAKADAAFERLRRRLEAPPSPYARVFLTAATGFGLRFNNPYRLTNQLGEDAASVSIPAPYLDFAATVALGNPDGVQHGASVHVGSSVDGVLQPFVTPSYALVYRASLPVLLYGRFGTPILLAPDANIGGELAGSVSYFLNSGLGLTSEIAFDLFYGAATLDQQYSVIPILNFQLGVIVDYEFLP